MNRNSYTSTDVLERSTKYETVMLIDDNPMDNMVNKGMIEKERFAKNLLIYGKAKTALDFLALADASQLPDLIFLDINMPEMDGFEFLDHFARLPEQVTRKSKVIMLSTSDSFKDLNKANKNRFVFKFLNKPLTELTLTAINL